MTDAMRSEFEEWAVDNGFSIKLRDDASSPDTYFAYETEQRWMVWQACAARMVPEKKVLPELLMAEYHEAKGWNACVESMLAAAPEPKP